MAKELPYFKFFPSEWVTGDITLCTMEAQGVFANICAFYWMKNCSMSLANAKQRFSNNMAALNQLLESAIIKVDDDDNIVINFLDKQMNEFVSVSEKRAISGSVGGKAKAKQLLKFAVAKPSYKEKEKEKDKDKEKEYNIPPFNFLNSILELGVKKEVAEEWVKFRKTKKCNNSKIAFEGIAKQIKESGFTANECIEKAVTRSWAGFEAKWMFEGQKPASKQLNGMFRPADNFD